MKPGERALQMTPAQLTSVRDAATAVSGQRGVHRFDDFIIYNEPGRSDQLKLLVSGLAYRLRAGRS
jgi:hydroxyacylglutathione hydrolase